MEGIILWRGDETRGDYVKAWCKHGRQEMYLFDHYTIEWDGLPDEVIFLQGGPKCLIKW